jgi:arabinan endo-1,5-alpha-L-arabinosidase
MRRFIMALGMPAILISISAAWPQQKAFAAAILDTTYKDKIAKENNGSVLGIASSSLTIGSMALQWSDNGTADHLWHLL